LTSFLGGSGVLRFFGGSFLLGGGERFLSSLLGGLRWRGGSRDLRGERGGGRESRTGRSPLELPPPPEPLYEGAVNLGGLGFLTLGAAYAPPELGSEVRAGGVLPLNPPSCLAGTAGCLMSAIGAGWESCWANCFCCARSFCAKILCIWVCVAWFWIGAGAGA